MRKSVPDMASLLSEDQFRCVICQDIFKDPASLPCGHNFCLKCIKDYWDSKTKIDCPLCKEVYIRRPEARVNVAFRDITEHFRRHQTMKPPQRKPVPPRRSHTLPAGLDLVPCDVCTVNRQPAVKSCLVCQLSYCQAHLRPHQVDPAMAAHRLTPPVPSTPSALSTAGRLCRSHNKRLDMFCLDDQTPVCPECTDHRRHKVVAVEKESQKVKAALKTTEAGFRQMLGSRIRKQEEIRAALESSKVRRDQQLQVGAQVFDAVREAVEDNHALLVDEIEWEQEAVEKGARQHLEELQQEIGELERRCGELELLEASSSDPLRLLQGFPALSAPLPARDWTGVQVHSGSYGGHVRASLSKLLKTCHDMEKELCGRELSQTRKHAVDVTLDAETAACWLVLSPDGKKVSLGVQPQRVTDNPRRFDSCVSVLGKEGFTTGRRYWEVQVGDKSDWDLGVARESVARKGAITVRPDKGYWAICRRQGGSLSACAGPSVTLQLPEPPRRVGVFLDYEEGVVAFYNAEAQTHIYTYAGCAFTERLHPYFNPGLHDHGKNTAPLVICPVAAAAAAEETVVL